jgi:hypothetical protein
MGGEKGIEEEGTETGKRGRRGTTEMECKDGNKRMEFCVNCVSGLRELTKNALGRCGGTIKMLIGIVKRYVGHLIYSASSWTSMVMTLKVYGNRQAYVFSSRIDGIAISNRSVLLSIVSRAPYQPNTQARGACYVFHVVVVDRVARLQLSHEPKYMFIDGRPYDEF